MRHIAAALVGFALLLSPNTASALCSYAGVLYARPTLQTEFVDADHVVRVRVETATQSWLLPGASEDDPPWSAYRLLVLDDFKRTAPAALTYFTKNDSGAFYLDEGEEFLLFLEPAQTGGPGVPPLASGSVSSNYCGNSKPWKEVTADERHTLVALSGSGARH